MAPIRETQRGRFLLLEQPILARPGHGYKNNRTTTTKRYMQKAAEDQRRAN